MKEKWKSVVGYEEGYLVSNLGRVKFLKKKGNQRGEHVSDGMMTKNGYMRVFLTGGGKDKGFFVHVLVATAFISNPKKKPQVNHKDGNKANNRKDNLEWATNSENQIHAFKLGLRVYDKGTRHVNSRKVGKFLNNIKIKEYPYMGAAAKEGYSESGICQAINKKYKHGGYNWKYLD